MEIYLIHTDHEIIDLITLDKQLWVNRLNELAKPDGELLSGDWAEVWKDNKVFYHVYRLSDIKLS